MVTPPVGALASTAAVAAVFVHCNQPHAATATAAFVSPLLVSRRSGAAVAGDVCCCRAAGPQQLIGLQPSSPSSRRKKRPLSDIAAAASKGRSQDEDKEDWDEEDEELFLRRELAHIESMEELLAGIAEQQAEFLDVDLDEERGGSEGSYGEEDNVDEEMEDMLWDAESLNELLGSIEEEGDDDYDDNGHVGEEEEEKIEDGRKENTSLLSRRPPLERKDPFGGLETALLSGVVPVSASVGSDSLPGDFGFDPLNLSTKDYFRQAQSFFLRFVPDAGDYREEEEQQRDNVNDSSEPRPRALILRDYREAEIRHSRLAMLAAVIWPLQEMLDRLVLPEDQFGPLIYGPVTLPYFPLLMTAILLLLGYLDIYSQAVKDLDQIGEAYEPGDCFWDPLRMLQGAPDTMRRRMQERELFNGRAAMLAVLAFTWEEAISHKALIELESNAILFQPAYQIPFIQQWLDSQFSVMDQTPTSLSPEDIAEMVTDVATSSGLQ